MKAVDESKSAIIYAKLIHRLLTHGDAYKELCDYTGLSYTCVVRYIKALRLFKDNDGHCLVRIAWWDEDIRGNLTRPAFKMEPGKDAKRPKITDAERQRRYRAKRKRRELDEAMRSAFSNPSESVGHSD